MHDLVILLRRISIRKRLIYAFLILTIVPTLLMIFTTSMFERVTYRENDRNNYENFAYESALKIDGVFTQIDSKFNYLKENNDILTDLFLYDSDEAYQTVYYERRMTGAFVSNFSTHSEIAYAGVVLENGKVIAYGVEGLTFVGSDVLALEEHAWHVVTVDGTEYLGKKEEVEIDYTSNRMVSFIVLMDLNELGELLLEAEGNDRQQVALQDEIGTWIAGRSIDEADSPYRVTLDVRGTNLKVLSTFEEKPYRIRGIYVIVLMFMLSLMLSGAILYLNYSSIRLPLEKLLERISSIEGNQDVMSASVTAYPSFGKDEHAVLNDEFSEMLARLQELLQEGYVTKIHEAELRTRIKELELASLQQRINPHFFYNLLDNVFWMAQMEGYEEIGEMISTLGAFFKTSVSEKGVFVGIGMEIENVKSYISLQKMMHRDLFEVSWSVEAGLMTYQTVKLVLQPIIENAIVHGFQRMTKGGLIEITGKAYDDCIEFSIRDNGCGMSESACQALREKMNSPSLGIGDSIGMRNVNQRIKLYFGETYGVAIASVPDEQTVVTLKLPKRSSICTD